MQAHNISLHMSRSGSILSISGVGRWLDRGLSKLMGGPDLPPQSGPGSTGSTHSSDFDAYAAKHKHRRNTSDQHLESDTPKVRHANLLGQLASIAGTTWQSSQGLGWAEEEGSAFSVLDDPVTQ